MFLVFFIWCFSFFFFFFSKGLFSFCDTSFLYLQFLFLCLQGIYSHRALGKGQGTGFSATKLNLWAQNIGRYLKLFMRILPVKSQVHCLFQFHEYFKEFVIVHHIPSVDAAVGRVTKAARSLALEVYVHIYMPSLKLWVFLEPCLTGSSYYWLFGSKLGHGDILFTWRYNVFLLHTFL